MEQILFHLSIPTPQLFSLKLFSYFNIVYLLSQLNIYKFLIFYVISDNTADRRRKYDFSEYNPKTNRTCYNRPMIDTGLDNPT